MKEAARENEKKGFRERETDRRQQETKTGVVTEKEGEEKDRQAR